MEYYHYLTGYRARFNSMFWMKVVFALIGLLIGSSVGLYVAVKTLPLPETKVYYINGN